MNIDMIAAQKWSLCALLPHSNSVETEVRMLKEKSFFLFFSKKQRGGECGLAGLAAVLFPPFWHHVWAGTSAMESIPGGDSLSSFACAIKFRHVTKAQ